MITKILLIIHSKGNKISNHILKLLNIKPIKKARKGWREQFNMMNKNNDDTLIIDDTTDLSDNNWVW